MSRTMDWTGSTAFRRPLGLADLAEPDAALLVRTGTAIGGTEKGFDISQTGSALYGRGRSFDSLAGWSICFCLLHAMLQLALSSRQIWRCFGIRSMVRRALSIAMLCSIWATKPAHAQEQRLDLQTWLDEIAEQHDTAWLIVADAQALANCKLGIIHALLAGTERHPRAFMFGAERKSTIQASMVYQLGLDPGNETAIRDKIAQDSLYRFPAMHKLLVQHGRLRSLLDQPQARPAPPPAALQDSAKAAFLLPGASLSHAGLPGDSNDPSGRQIRQQSIAPKVDSFLLDEESGAYSRAALFTDGGEAGWFVLDYLFHRLHRIDSTSGQTNVLWEFSEPYPEFYHSFKWVDPVPDSLLHAYADPGNPFHAAMRPEAPNLSVLGNRIYLAFYRRVPVLETDGTIGLYMRPFLYRLDTALQITGRAMGQMEDLPEGMAWRLQHMLAWTDSSGVMTCLSTQPLEYAGTKVGAGSKGASLQTGAQRANKASGAKTTSVNQLANGAAIDSLPARGVQSPYPQALSKKKDQGFASVDTLHPNLLAAYRVYWARQRWELKAPFPVSLPDVLGLGKGHTGMARGYLAGNEQHWSFAFALAAEGLVFPGPRKLCFPDTAADKRNELQTSGGGIPRTPWTLAGLGPWPGGGWVYWEQDAEFGDRLVRVSASGRNCTAWLPVPPALKTVMVHLAAGHAYAVRSRGEALYLYRWRLPRGSGAWRSF